MIYYVRFSKSVFKEDFLMKLEEKLSFCGMVEKIKNHKGCLVFYNDDLSISHSTDEEYNYLIRNFKEFFFQLSKDNRLINVFNNIDFDFFINDKRYKPSEFKSVECDISIAKEKIDRVILESNLKKVLIFSKKAIIIDPYFSIYHKKSILEMIDRFIGTKTNMKNFKIEIHLHIKCDGKYLYNNLQEWKNYVDNSKNQIEVYVWDDKDSNKKMHDRYLITDKFFINMGKGLEEHSDKYSTFTTWNLNKYEDVREIYNNYKENSSPFKLTYKITKGDSNV